MIFIVRHMDQSFFRFYILSYIRIYRIIYLRRILEIDISLHDRINGKCRRTQEQKTYYT